MAHSCSPLLLLLLLPLFSFSSPSPTPSHYPIYPRKSTKTTPTYHSRVISGMNIDYLIEISVGTPSINVLALLDTGSDLTWFQCSTCPDCYNEPRAIYKQWNLSSYATLPCNADECSVLPVWKCGQQLGVCHYDYSYGEGSHTLGLLSPEIFHFGSFRSRLLFGCSMESQGSFDILSGGIVELRGGPLSLMSQMADSSCGFSYCLPTYDEQETGSLYIGKVFDGLIASPMVSCDKLGMYYCITLSRIEIGSNFSTSTKKIDILIDSGTSLTLLPNDMLQQIINYVVQVVDKSVVKNYQMNGLLCFDMGTSGETLWRKLPVISFIFSGGRVSLSPHNTFQINLEGVVSLAMDSSESGIPTFGNIAQQNNLVSYDIQEREVYFGPANCTLPLPAIKRSH